MKVLVYSEGLGIWLVVGGVVVELWGMVGDVGGGGGRGYLLL